MPITQVREAGALTLTLAVFPGVAGSNEINLFFQDASGADGQVSKVLFRLTYLDAAVRSLEAEAIVAHPGHAFIIGEHLRHAGRWRIEAVLHRPALPEAKAAFDVRIQ